MASNLFFFFFLSEYVIADEAMFGKGFIDRDMDFWNTIGAGN